MPKVARQRAGLELLRMQHGKNPIDWKPGIGAGAIEIRVKAENEYRIFTVAKFEYAIYVLHVFVKKSKKTPQGCVEIAKRRYNELKERLR